MVAFEGHIKVWGDELSFANAFSHPHAGIQSDHPQLMVKRHPHADRDEVHVGMLDHFVRVGKSVGNPEMLRRFVCGFLAARADRGDLELRKRAQRRNVASRPQPLRILAPMMPTRIFLMP
jgi:hypothetical protein